MDRRVVRVECEELILIVFRFEHKSSDRCESSTINLWEPRGEL
jgi:hypothetical protein